MNRFANLAPACGSFASWLDGKFFALPYALGILVAVMAAICILSYRTKQLTAGGTACEFLVGFGITWILGFGALFTMLFFFIGAGVVGAYSKAMRATRAVAQKKGGTRDQVQVMANGGLALVWALCYAVRQSPVFLAMFAASIAEAAADTAADEVGILSSRPPVSILTGRPMPKGESGAVSSLGFLASFIASFLTAWIWQGCFLYPDLTALQAVAVVGFCGVFGAAFDSVLGASCQAVYEDPERHKLTERETDAQGRPLRLVRGMRWMNNDMVNLLSCLTASLFCGLLASVVFR